MMITQWAGINVITAYMVTIFTTSGSRYQKSTHHLIRLINFAALIPILLPSWSAASSRPLPWSQQEFSGENSPPLDQISFSGSVHASLSSLSVPP